MSLATTSDRYYALLVQDDGRHVVQQEGNGLRGMRERVSGLGGRCDRGTQLLIELPSLRGKVSLYDINAQIRCQLKHNRK